MGRNLRTTKQQAISHWLLVIRYFYFFWLLLSIAYCLLSPSSCEAQSDVIKYARQIVDTLASPSMYGRGYVNKGDSIAAAYIKKEFEKLRIQSFENEFYQRFSFSINTFPENIKITTKEALLIPGIDFIVQGNSGHIQDSIEVIFFNKNILLSKKQKKKFKKISLSDKAILVDKEGIAQIKDGQNLLDAFELNLFKAKAVLFTEDKKLTYGHSVHREDYPLAVILKEKANTITHGKIFLSIQNKYFSNYTSQNIIGYISGTQYPDSFIVFIAHYDHLGMMGKDVYFPGANDNASGCAMLLCLAKYYSQHPHAYSVAFMAFGAEEAGLLGSKYYVENPLFDLKKIKFLVNFDIVGTGDEGIKVVNATEHKKEFDELVKINEEKKLLPGIQPRGKAAISDHHFFEDAGVKTFYIYTLGGIKAYHDIYDRAETLPLTKFEELYKLVIDFSDTLQK